MNAPVTSPATGMNKAWVERRNKAVSRGIGMGAAVMAEKAENSEIWDIEGNRYIDFGGGIAVVNTGHRHPMVMKRVYEQLEKVTHTCAMVMPYTPFVEVCEKLNAAAPIKGDVKSALVTTGAEAVENAIKYARCYTFRNGADRQSAAL
jgi:4-aminobutyrate aminotransferase / (S)-3-amino-2-methylpropionate transaminase / 5-aminovalerate transaminase